MQWIDKNKQIKYVLILAAVAIATISLVFSQYLVRDLEKDARSKMSVWAEAMRTLNNADENTDLGLVLKVINNNSTIPVIVVNKKGHVMEFRNIKLKYEDQADSVKVLHQKVLEMRESGYSIKMSYSSKKDFDRGDYIEILYEDSVLLKRLAIYPYVQLGV